MEGVNPTPLSSSSSRIFETSKMVTDLNCAEAAEIYRAKPYNFLLLLVFLVNASWIYMLIQAAFMLYRKGVSVFCVLHKKLVGNCKCAKSFQRSVFLMPIKK